MMFGRRATPPPAPAAAQLTAAQRAQIDIAGFYYTSTRDEINQRIRNRDNVLSLYLLASATIFGLALANESQARLAFIIPVLGLGATITHAQHNTVIGAMTERCSKLGVDFKVLPPVRDLLGGRVSIRDVRDINVADLLGRNAIETDIESIAQNT